MPWPGCTRRTAVFAAVALAAWAVGAVLAWLAGSPLGHDEAQYVLAGRDLIHGAEPRWFYASTGVTAVASLGVLAGDGELALRVPGLVLGIGFAVAAGGLAWRLFGAQTAAWFVLVLAATRSFARASVLLLSDLPSTALLLAATAIVAVEVTREDGPRWRLVIAAPLAAAALYVRYASCVPIALIAAAALAVGWRAIARRPWPVIATAGLLAALLVPHFVQAIQITGSPLGILLWSKDVPGQTWLGEGLATYVTSNPFRYYGLLAPPLLLAGLASIGWLRDRRAVLLWLVAVGDIVALGLISHAQVRYVFFGIALLLLLGIEVVRRAVAAVPRARVRVALAAAALVAVTAAWIAVAAGQGRRSRIDGLLAAASAMRADAAGARCYVVADAYSQLEWYSGCRSEWWPWDTRRPGDVIYTVTTPTSSVRETRGRPRVILARPDATVTRWEP